MAGYLYLVLSVGPWFMKNRKPFEIKKILIAYNAFQIVANIFVWIYVSVFLCDFFDIKKFIEFITTIDVQSYIFPRNIQSDLQ